MTMRLCLGFIVMLLSACDGDSEVFEEIKKLRGLGVGIDPVIAFPSTEANPQVVTLTLHAAAPAGEDITTELYEEEDDILSPNIAGLKITPGSEQYTEYQSLRHYTVKATFTVPINDILQLEKRKGAMNLRYAFKLTSGSEEEKIVGKVSVLDPASEDGKKTWQEPVLSIQSPVDTIGRDAKVDVKANLTNSNDEEVKIGWFVSKGKLENRRAQETKWETGGDDRQVLIGTVRGKRSHSFAIEIKEYSVE